MAKFYSGYLVEGLHPGRFGELKQQALPKTCHSQPWALIRCNGDTGRQADLDPHGLPGRYDCTERHRSRAHRLHHAQWHDRVDEASAPHREWSDIICQWTRQPTSAEVCRVKSRLPVAED